jgi:GMP synthase-like glutamine amidotransferase
MVAQNMTSSERVLVIEHEHDAGPEMFRQWLTAAGVTVEVCRPYAGDALPERVDHGGLLVLGGSMGARDDHKAPWLAHVRAMLAEATAQGRPVLGICLGAQMLAAACGGRVEPSQSGGEIGLGRIVLNDEARRDPLFGGMQSPVQAAQWHLDEITELPAGAVLLGSSPRCRVQAYRLGSCAWGVQFHPEVSGAVLEAWVETDRELPPERLHQMELAIAEVRACESRLFGCWKRFAGRFAAVVRQG